MRDLSGTEIYRGTIAMDGTTVLIDGEYTYVVDDDVAMMCFGIWLYSGTYIP